MPPASHNVRAAAISLTQQTSAMPMRLSVSTNARVLARDENDACRLEANRQAAAQRNHHLNSL